MPGLTVQFCQVAASRKLLIVIIVPAVVLACCLVAAIVGVLYWRKRSRAARLVAAEHQHGLSLVSVAIGRPAGGVPEWAPLAAGGGAAVASAPPPGKGAF